jgi:hypothetical protein
VYDIICIQGFPIRGDVYALNISGKRQEWKYVIEYFGGDKQNFILPCVSLPSSKLTRQEVFQRVRASTRQELRSDSALQMQDAKANITKVLTVRQDTEFLPEWNLFFDSIPDTNIIEHDSYNNVLLTLANDVGGFIQKKEPHFATYKTYLTEHSNILF